MRRGKTVICGLCIVAMLVGACQQTEPRYDEGAQTKRKHLEPKYTIGWQQIKNGMDPAEVLSVLDEPVDIKVTQVSTYWYYSERGSEGPYVGFDTRTMKVDRWRPPASD